VPELAEPPEAPLPACPDCGVALQDERQEICVECGAAVAPERGARRLRWALQPVALGVFATLMVASAAYGLTSNLGDTPAVVDRVAAAPPQAAPPTAQAPPAPTPPPAPPTPPATTPAPASPSPAPAATPKPPAPSAAAKPAAPAASSPAPSPSPSRSHAPSPQSTPSGGAGTPARHHPTHRHTSPSWLSEGDQPYSATLYDPYGDGTDEHAAAAGKSVDGHAGTAWTTADHPGGLGKPGVGLVVEAGGYQSYSAIGIQTATPGFKVEIYSTDASDPPAGGPTAAGWRREGSIANVEKQERIAMKGATDQPSYVLVWITTLPAGKSRAGLSEISLLP
jgi:hypothetical protein